VVKIDPDVTLTSRKAGQNARRPHLASAGAFDGRKCMRAALLLPVG